MIQDNIKKPLADEILFGKLKDGGTVRVLLEEKDGDKALGFEYIKSDTPIRPRDPEDDEPEDGGPEDDGDGGTKLAGRKAKAKGGGKRSRTSAKPKVGPSAVPKVPLGSR